jgi:GxxExxY protein
MTDAQLIAPGLLEAVDEEYLYYQLSNRRMQFAGQKPIAVVYKNAKLDCGYRADIVVADRIIVAIKAIAAPHQSHEPSC